ncbi:sigma-54 interaction domain-containing protein [Anoxynatronum sibiricum]|uniref:Sigma 54-interacting transcriptional regulator n=1 Tax=Anoxynatronum sibiricum TaxID=210623 RepID=A0ABU9VPD4_9CLOT
MKTQHLILITGTEPTQRSLEKQLRVIFDGSHVSVVSYAIDTGLPAELTADLILFSSPQVEDEMMAMNRLKKEQKTLTAARSIAMDHLEQVMRIPAGSAVLLVNDVPASAQESVAALHRIGVDHVNLIPWWPEAPLPHPIPVYGITPGEPALVPRGVTQVVDIGPRVCDFSTVVQLLEKLDLFDGCSTVFSEGYLKKIIHMAGRLARSHEAIESLNRHLQAVLDGLNDGLLVFDQQGMISFINENARRLLHLPNLRQGGLSLGRLIPFRELRQFLMTPGASERVFTLFDQPVLVKRLESLQTGETTAVFQNVAETIASGQQIKRDLVRKGHYARYTFDDLVGTSPSLTQVVNTAKKLAASGLTVLLVGESGTGKEIFASAIHNASPRQQGPFLAVNFSALSDELIESELFGYEEGSFTGARKGGKIGLFEQADGGTLFLDEIGDVSLKVQARLLRVLQEKEIMPVGGQAIRTIDVRIVAATNRSLEQLVAQGQFREDLYYRLKMGYLNLPPLRHRREDVLDLAQHFIRLETSRLIQLSEDVSRALVSYHWPGNVRELQNTVSYMLAVADTPLMTMAHLPAAAFFTPSENREKPFLIRHLTPLQRLMVKVGELEDRGQSPGRGSLLAAMNAEDPLGGWTAHKVRMALVELEEKGHLTAGVGRQGSRLTEAGRLAWRQLIQKER